MTNQRYKPYAAYSPRTSKPSTGRGGGARCRRLAIHGFTLHVDSFDSNRRRSLAFGADCGRSHGSHDFEGASQKQWQSSPPRDPSSRAPPPRDPFRQGRPGTKLRLTFLTATPTSVGPQAEALALGLARGRGPWPKAQGFGWATAAAQAQGQGLGLGPQANRRRGGYPEPESLDRPAMPF